MANHEWYPRYPKDEMSSALRVLTCEELGFLDRLRDFSWVNGGIPNDETFVRALARTFGLSSYKFRKLWPRVVKFFDEYSGVFLYPDDEIRRTKSIEIIANRKWASHLAHEARWGGKLYAVEKDMPNAMPNACQTHNPPVVVVVSHSTETEREQQQTNNRAREETPPKTLEPKQELLAYPEITAIQQKAIDLGMPAPTPELAMKIRQKFSLELPMAGVIGLLVRWEGQRTVGLWLGMSQQDFEREAARQAAGTPRKPTQRAIEDRRLMERAMERDRANGRL